MHRFLSLLMYLLLGFVPFYQADPGVLISTGDMIKPRAAQTATILQDGRILLVGGMTGERTMPAADAEIYDAKTGAFVPAGPMLTPRHSHTATILPDGTVLIAGGYDAQGEYLPSAEIYDPARDEFTAVGSMHSARAGHVAEVLQDGSVLLAGGVGTGWTFLSSAERYDPKTQTFARAGSMQVPRESHAAVGLPDGRVFVVGGHQGRRENMALYKSAEMYNPGTNTFSPAGEMTVRRHKHDAVLLPDGRVLITGGSDERDMHGRYASAEIYDPVKGIYDRISDMQLARYKHEGTSVVLSNGQVLIAGGAAQAELFDPEKNEFRLVEGKARMAGQFSASALLPDGNVLITGGYGGGTGPRSSAWLYQP